jgi:hypothetical protein
MRSIARPLEVGCIESSTPRFEVVLAYEDFQSGIRSKGLFDRLVRNHGNRLRFLCHLWKFDVLAAPEFSGQAIAEAVNADMIVIAPRARSELPNSVKRWIEHWRHEPRTPGALVALLDDVESQSAPVSTACTYLHDIANTSQMRFFCNASPLSEMIFASPLEVIQRPEASDSLKSRVRFRDFAGQSHWGINE